MKRNASAAWSGGLKEGSGTISTASGDAGSPTAAANPADSTSNPRAGSSFTATPSVSASSRRHKTSAIGLRQVFPVQTKTVLLLALEVNSPAASDPSRAIRT